MSTLQNGELLRTIHGSHLYGMAHQDSDEDWYIVRLDGKSRQKVVDGVDTNVVTLEQFLKSIDKGVPQAVEALFSPYAEVDPNWGPFFYGLRPGNSLIDTYRRTILNFGLNHGGRHGAALERAKTSDKIKLRRHALRLCINLSQFVRYGMIDPMIPPELTKRITDASEESDDVFSHLLDVSVSKSIIGDLLDV